MTAASTSPATRETVENPSEVDYDDGCGVAYDHANDVVYDGPDGVQWVCTRCGAEGWEDAD